MASPPGGPRLLVAVEGGGWGRQRQSAVGRGGKGWLRRTRRARRHPLRWTPCPLPGGWTRSRGARRAVGARRRCSGSGSACCPWRPSRTPPAVPGSRVRGWAGARPLRRGSSAACRTPRASSAAGRAAGLRRARRPLTSPSKSSPSRPAAAAAARGARAPTLEAAARAPRWGLWAPGARLPCTSPAQSGLRRGKSHCTCRDRSSVETKRVQRRKGTGPDSRARSPGRRRSWRPSPGFLPGGADTSAAFPRQAGSLRGGRGRRGAHLRPGARRALPRLRARGWVRAALGRVRPFADGSGRGGGSETAAT